MCGRLQRRKRGTEVINLECYCDSRCCVLLQDNGRMSKETGEAGVGGREDGE